MSVTRRDVLKVGGLGVLGAVAALGLPWGSTVGARSRERLAASRMPQPFRAPFRRPPVLRPWRSVRDANGEWVDLFRITEQQGQARIIPGIATGVCGYNGVTPGPTINVMRGHRAVVRVRNHPPARHPVLGQELATSVHLH